MQTVHHDVRCFLHICKITTWCCHVQQNAIFVQYSVKENYALSLKSFVRFCFQLEVVCLAHVRSAVRLCVCGVLAGCHLFFIVSLLIVSVSPFCVISSLLSCSSTCVFDRCWCCWPFCNLLYVSPLDTSPHISLILHSVSLLQLLFVRLACFGVSAAFSGSDFSTLM